MKSEPTSNFLKFTMVYEKTVFLDYRMSENCYLALTKWLEKKEAMQVASLIEKLPPFKQEYKSYLKHISRDMSLANLIVHTKCKK